MGICQSLVKYSALFMHNSQIDSSETKWYLQSVGKVHSKKYFWGRFARYFSSKVVTKKRKPIRNLIIIKTKAEN